MAVGTDAGGTWNTTAGNKTVVATPATNDLIVVIHGMSGWASGDNSTITDNNSGGGGTYTRLGTATAPLSQQGGTAGALWISVRNNLISSATSTTFTCTNTGDTGGGLTVLRFSGMTRTGANAIRQSKGESSQTENPPTLTFDAATLTANPIILAVMGEDNPAAVTPPTGFTEADDTGWATPTTGIQVCWDDSGNTASAYSWSGGALTDHNEVGIELDTSALDYPLDSTPGSYTITGTSARLDAQFLLSSTPGSYTLTGSNATLLQELLLATTPGSYTITGIDATLLVGDVLNVTPGSYTITGSDVDLTVQSTAPEIIVTPGSYTITGSDAALVVDKVLSTTPESYAITAQDVTLVRESLLLTTPGSYSITGSDVYLSKEYTLISNSGSYTYTGSDAELLVDRTLRINPGAYVLTGSTVTFEKPVWPSPSTVLAGTLYGPTGENYVGTYVPPTPTPTTTTVTTGPVGLREIQMLRRLEDNPKTRALRRRVR